MKSQFVPSKLVSVVLKKCPWALILLKYQNGFLAFETAAAYRAWKLQK